MMEWGQLLQGQQVAVTWFTETQLQSVIGNGIVPEWFHGIISRKTAEELLMSKPPGYFLIRVSESRIGYTLSYRAEDLCRHFMIDALEDGHYLIVGENRRHRFLQDLVDFHRRTPIMPFSEVLTVACGQSSNDNADNAELLLPQRHSNTSLLQNNLQSNMSCPVSHTDTLPAHPFRPCNLTNSAVLSPSSQPNRLYPCLENELPHVTSPLTTMPVPVTGKSYSPDSTSANQPPEAPSHSVLVKNNQVCIRTDSASTSSFAQTTAEHPLGVNIHPVKNREAKPSVVTNLKNLKKKFQKKRSVSQRDAEINMETTDRRGSAESEYLEITGEQTCDGAPFSYTCTDVMLTHGALPQEYRPPPPFAPGY